MSEGIAYQNKDIEFKLLSETFKEKSFAAYGLQLPRIKEVPEIRMIVLYTGDVESAKDTFHAGCITLQME